MGLNFRCSMKNYDYDHGWHNSTSRVDIYDARSNTWSTTELPEARNFMLAKNEAIIGNKVFFAGRFDAYETWDVTVYDDSTNSWSYIALNQPRWAPEIVAGGNKIFIAGGEVPFAYLRSVEVYDASANLLAVDSLSDARRDIMAATLNNKTFFAGGSPSTGRVDIYNFTTQTWSTANLSGAAVLAGAVSVGQRICFFGDKRVDIYDVSSNTWSIADLPVSFSESSAFITAGLHIFL